MVDHGIETEEDRIEKTKPHRGTIKVEFKNGGEDFSIKLSDDGGGIDPEIIKEKILEKGLKKEEDLKDLSHSDIVNLIFLQNFSTKEEVTNVSGRGVGMIAVKEEVEKLGGEITVSSKIDEGTTYTIKLPTLS
jgi:two-component system chemotaxis sensor kinase CheA